MKKISLYCSTVFKNKIKKDDAIAKSYEIINRLNQEIGNPTDLTESYMNEISSIDTEIRLLKKSTDPKSQSRIKKKIRDKKMYKKRIASEKKRVSLHKKIYTDLGQHIADILVKTHFMMDYADIVDSFNLMSRKYLGFPLMDLNGKNIPTLKTYQNMINRFVKVKPNEKMSKWNEFSQDTFRMVATQEETGTGLILLNKIQGLKDAIYEQQKPLVEEYSEINSFYIRKIEALLATNLDKDGGVNKNLVFRNQNKMMMTYPIVIDDDGEERVQRELVVEKYWDELSKKEKENIIVDDYINLKSDLADGRVRYIQPMLYQHLTEEEKEFVGSYKNKYTNEYGEKYSGPSHHEMILKNDDKSESVWVMLKRNEDQSDSDIEHEYWAAVMIRKGFVDSETGDFMWESGMGLQLEDSWEGTGIESGFYEANKHQKYDYTIEGTNTKVGSYSDFKYLEKQPNKKLAGVEEVGVSTSGQYNVWQALSLQRDLNAKIFDIFEKEIKSGNEEYLEVVRLAEIKFKKDGMDDVKNFIEEIEEIGQMSANILYTDDGVILGWDTFMKKVRHSFDPRIFLRDDYWADADEAIYGSKRDRDTLESSLAESEQIINQYNEGVSTGEQLISTSEFAFHFQKAANHKHKIKQLTEIIDNMEEMREIAILEPSKENMKKMKLASQSVHSKHRQTFTNPMNRRRDVNVHRDYITKFITALQYKKLKTDLLKGMLVIDSNDMKHWLLNQTKIAIQDYTYDAGFMGFKYGFQEYADAKNKVLKALGSKRRVTPSEVAKDAANHNNWVSGLVLNTMSSVTNLTQLESLIEEWGITDFPSKAQMEDPEIIEALKMTGVEDLITAYTDFMAGGTTGDITATTFIRARFNWALLKLNKSDFINKKTPMDEWLNSLLPEKDKDNFNALKRQRALFYNQMNELKKLLKKYGSYIEEEDVGKENRDGEIKEIKATKKEILILKQRIRELNRNLNSSQINQLASWMLTWQVSKKLEILTFSGAELFMRRRGAVSGMLTAERMNLLNAEEGKNRYKEAPAQSMGRATVYNTMFGMSREYFPKMFGGVGGVYGFQFKTYTFAQWVREYNIMEKFFSTHKGGVFNVPGWLPRLLKAYNQKIIRTYRGDKIGYAELLVSGDPNFDISAERFATFLGIRGLISAVTTTLFYTPFLTESLGVVLRKLTGAGHLSVLNTVRGGQSIIISTIMKALLLAFAANGAMDEDEEERLYQDWYMFFLPVFVNAMIQLAKGNPDRAARTYVPGSKVITDIYEIND